MRVGTRPGATGGGIWHEPMVQDIVVGTEDGRRREEGGGRETACGAAEDARHRLGNSAAAGAGCRTGAATADPETQVRPGLLN